MGNKKKRAARELELEAAHNTEPTSATIALGRSARKRQ
jgi:hypothetical protein